MFLIVLMVTPLLMSKEIDNLEPLRWAYRIVLIQSSSAQAPHVKQMLEADQAEIDAVRHELGLDPGTRKTRDRQVVARAGPGRRREHPARDDVIMAIELAHLPSKPDRTRRCPACNPQGLELMELGNSAEKVPFSNERLQEMLELGRKGCMELVEAQKQALGL